MVGRTKTVARVTLTVEIEIAQRWGGHCTMEQVFAQARESAIGAARRGLALHSMVSGVDVKTPARIIGDPKVVAILVDDISPETPSEPEVPRG